MYYLDSKSHLLLRFFSWASDEGKRVLSFLSDDYDSETRLKFSPMRTNFSDAELQLLRKCYSKITINFVGNLLGFRATGAFEGHRSVDARNSKLELLVLPEVL